MEISLFRICLLALCGLLFCCVLKIGKPEFLPPIRIAIIILLAGMCLILASPILEWINRISKEAEISDKTNILFKALGIAVLGEICSDICKECGENALGDGVETATKIELLLLALPLLESILSIAKEFFYSL